MFLTKFLITFGLITIAITDQSVNEQLPTDLVNDLMKIAQRIAGDQENIFKLTKQLKEFAAGNPVAQQLSSNQRAIELGNKNRLTLRAPESNQIGGNPLVTLQSRINAFFDSMNQLFDNMRHILERFPVPEDTDIDPLKALQTLEQQFKSMLSGLRVDQNETLIADVDQQLIRPSENDNNQIQI